MRMMELRVSKNQELRSLYSTFKFYCSGKGNPTCSGCKLRFRCITTNRIVTIIDEDLHKALIHQAWNWRRKHFDGWRTDE